MSILDANGVIACAECGRQARAVRDRLQAENAKLRELVRNVEHYERFGCQGCPNARGCTAPMLYDERCSMRQKIDNDKRELGIEVDGCPSPAR